jgi:hypothetical protein
MRSSADSSRIMPPSAETSWMRASWTVRRACTGGRAAASTYRRGRPAPARLASPPSGAFPPAALHVRRKEGRLAQIRSVLVVAVLVVVVLPSSLPATGALAPGPCTLHRAEGETVPHLSKRLINCAVGRFGPVPGGTHRAICIARRESGLDPKATSSPTGRYRGLYQHERGMWPARYDRYTKPDWELSESALNGRTNSIVTIRMVHAIGSWRRAGWPPRAC